MPETLYQSKCYFFLFAHPDDEIYTSVLLNRLVNKNKKVHVVYATSGDSWWNPELRSSELKKSMNIIWIEESNIHMLEVSEKDIMKSVKDIVNKTCDLVKKYDWDCIIWQDYEGWHEWHDIVSFCASEVASKCNINKFFVFPIYHWRPWERKWARFKPERDKNIELKLTQKEKNIKEKVLNSHSSQKWHFDWLKKSSSDYMDFLLSRELYFEVKEDIDYTKKPTDEVWYEYHRNGFKFYDFTNAINKYYKIW